MDNRKIGFNDSLCNLKLLNFSVPVSASVMGGADFYLI